MTSLLAQLYLDLSTYLKTAVPALKWIDQDFGQLEIYEYRPNVNFPCVLIDFSAAQFENQSRLVQSGFLTVTIRLGFAPFSQSYQEAPLNVKEKALEYYDLEQELYKALQGWQPENAGERYAQPFIRVSAQTEQRVSASGAQDASGLRVRIITFTTYYDDLSAMKAVTKHPATLEVQQEIQTP
jgi:hypothetical protein